MVNSRDHRCEPSIARYNPSTRVAIDSGTQLGPDEIQSALGAGGMGEVYKARDTRLNRVVAIKVLPRGVADDPRRRERFDREALAISSLNHPHICTLYDVGHQDGVDYLVMELLEGQTLSERIAKGALPLDQALQTAIQIADALDAAHRKGIVHRDLKPANVFLARRGGPSGPPIVKLLDFGIARLTQPASATDSPAAAMTQGTLTAEGTLLGTVQYMSPEQLEGRDADARSDVFAFGALLYEMLTGRRAFAGESQSSVIAAILEREPSPLTAVQPQTPPALDRLVRKALAKNPDDRWQSIRDLRDELQWMAGERTAAASPAAAGRFGQKFAWVVAGLSLAAAVAVGAAAYLGRPATDLHLGVYRSTFALPSALSGRVTLALSPDGTQLALAAAGYVGRTPLWVRPLNGLSTRPIAGTEGATAPFWSPDSRSIAFVANGKLQKVDVSGGPAVSLSDRGRALPGAWSREGTILFSATSDEIARVSAAGGSPSTVTVKDTSAGELALRFPWFLPDGRHFLFSAVAEPRGGVAYVGSLDKRERTRVLDGLMNVQYAGGYLFFVRGRTLMAQPFDAERFRLAGEPTPVAEQVRTQSSTTPIGAFTVSNTVLAFQHAADVSGKSRLVWFDRSGSQTRVLGEPDIYGGVLTNASAEVSLSTDGRFATVVAPPDHPDVWIFDVARGARTRLTFDPAGASAPLWSPDGKFVAFRSVRNGHQDIYRRAANGAGADELLFGDLSNKIPESWSPDGQDILYAAAGAAPGAPIWIWALPLFGDRKPFPFVQSQFTTNRAQFSPEGRWVAYQSSESGQSEGVT